MIQPYFSIYSRLGDDLSREIFLERIKYSFSGSFSNDTGIVDWFSLLRKSVCKEVFTEWDEFLNKAMLEKFKNKECFIFGASNCGAVALEQLKYVNDKLNVTGFIDNYKQGTFLELPVYSFDDLLTKPDSIIILANSQKEHAAQIMYQIETSVFPRANVYRMFDHELLYGMEYFDIIPPPRGKAEVFIDAGCYNGDTTLEFVKWCNANYGKIYAFEAEHNNFKACKENLENIENLELIECGLYDSDGEIEINIAPDNRQSCHTLAEINDTVNAGIVYGDKLKIKTRKLDSVLNGSLATFIKMDIEGAEVPALRGAEQTIRRYKPKLAIAVYHKPDDILEIPRLILEYNPEYKLYLRHYSPFNSETDLYAL